MMVVLGLPLSQDSQDYKEKHCLKKNKKKIVMGQ